jgi:predicted ATPase
MVFEDAHWSDPTSLEAFGRVIDRIASLRVLLLVTFRPEFAPPWIGQPHVTALTLNRLPKRAIDAMIDGVVGNKLLPASIRQDIIERTDGIPLFVEEMTKAVLEAESEGEARRTAAAVPWPVVAVPASLQASLMARLDRLGRAKETAQIGAAIGREFSHSLLFAVSRKPEAELAASLDRLIQSGLLSRQGLPPHATYLFKHALVQDAAYGTLLREPRRALHGRIAETLEGQFTEIAENQPELLARHCTEAGLIEKAARLWGKAGQRSVARSAFVEAAEQFKRALSQIATLPPTAVLRREEIKLQVAMITPLMIVGGFAAPEMKSTVERARKLIEEAEARRECVEDPLLLFAALNGLWLVNFGAFDGQACCDIATQFLALAEKQTTSFPLAQGHRLLGRSLLHTGDLTQGRTHLDKAIALYDPAAHRPLATRFGQDIRTASLSSRSMALWPLGYPEAGLADVDLAVSDAREIGHAASLFFALFGAFWTRIMCGNYVAAQGFADELAVLSEETGASMWKRTAVIGRGWISALTDNSSDAVQILTSGVESAWAAGTTVHWAVVVALLGKAHAQLGQFDEAWRRISGAKGTVRTTDERWFEAEIYRLAGDVALLSPDPDATKAQSYFARALAVAQAQQAKSWELRAAMSMARLWRNQGKRDEARGLLAPVYGWFTEGFDTRDLKQAKALVDELSS